MSAGIEAIGTSHPIARAPKISPLKQPVVQIGIVTGSTGRAWKQTLHRAQLCCRN